MAMMAITTRSSIRVNPVRDDPRQRTTHTFMDRPRRNKEYNEKKVDGPSAGSAVPGKASTRRNGSGTPGGGPNRLRAYSILANSPHNFQSSLMKTRRRHAAFFLPSPRRGGGEPV